MAIVFLSVLIFGTAMAIMAVGVMFHRPCLRGSCGGPEVAGPDGESLSCSTCPRRREEGSE